MRVEKNSSKILESDISNAKVNSNSSRQSSKIYSELSAESSKLSKLYSNILPTKILVSIKSEDDSSIPIGALVGVKGELQTLEEPGNPRTV